MHARTPAATATALLVALTTLLPAPHARAGGMTGGPWVIAHRGASAYAPENTLASIDTAARLGFTWVENDVQRTRDGRLVVIHDESLARTTNVEEVFPGRAPWKVKDFTAAEISRLDAGSWFSPAYAGTRAPTLEQYMRRVGHNRQKLLLEIKNPERYPGIEQQTLKLLSNEGWLDRPHLGGRLIVQSFSADSLRIVHDLEPSVTTGLLGSPPVTELPRYAVFADLVNPSQASLSPAYASAVHALTGPHGRRLALCSWTVDDAATARKAALDGVDGVISNRPDVVRAALGSD